MLTPTLIWPDFRPDDVETAGRRVRRRLRRAGELSHDARSALELAGLALDAPGLPAVALLRLAQGSEAAKDEYLAEPVTLGPDRDRLMLHRLSADALDAEEAGALVEAAHAHFSAAELFIERAESAWFVRLPGSQAQPGLSVEQAQETLLSPLPEQFGVDVKGMRVLNELQMLWYAHPVNEARREHGRAEANALWVWGGGCLPERLSGRAKPAVLAATDAEMAGLAGWLASAHETPAAALEQADIGECLVVIAAGETELGWRWLERLCASRGGFRLLAANREWQVPARRWGRHW